MLRPTGLVLAIVVTVGAGCGGSSPMGTAGAAGNVGSSGAAGTVGSTGAAGTTGAAGSASDGGADALQPCGNRDDPSSGLECHDVEALGICVATTISTTPTPASMGGVFRAGTYWLVWRTLHVFNPDAGSSVGGDTRRETLVFEGAGPSFTLKTTQASGTTIERQLGTVTTSGTKATYAPTCPPPADGGSADGGAAGRSVSYTATEATIIWMETQSNGVLVSLYQKR